MHTVMHSSSYELAQISQESIPFEFTLRLKCSQIKKAKKKNKNKKLIIHKVLLYNHWQGVLHACCTIKHVIIIKLLVSAGQKIRQEKLIWY